MVVPSLGNVGTTPCAVNSSGRSGEQPNVDVAYAAVASRHEIRSQGT